MIQKIGFALASVAPVRSEFSAARWCAAFLRAILIIASLALATLVAAQAPGSSTAVFDGTYAGVSRENTWITSSGTVPTLARPATPSDNASCGQNGVPFPLTITNGVVRSTPDYWEGTVSPQGIVVMRNGTRVRSCTDFRRQIGLPLRLLAPDPCGGAIHEAALPSYDAFIVDLGRQSPGDEKRTKKKLNRLAKKGSLLKTRNSLLAGKIQGNSSILASDIRIFHRKH
jgi:hypothetical protein